ncbi:pilus assembly protein [Roseomonas hellenica]|uniref:Pilus assembly protein n=1 Tax=Plastoroseomonas hellenica TaxID=2687306 RepID=A0ABS5EVA4_9PROT|nr:TadE family protein [Plastoroseomonas hellenica]MBR0664235.1 pilus assembly protein [Plastoroseomonas hellenica]
MPSHHGQRLLDRLRRDRRGVSIVEFAVIANVVLVLLLIGFEAAFQMVISTALDHGAREASRTAALGPVGGVTSRDAVLARVLTRAGLPLGAWGTASITAERFTDYAALASSGALPAGNLCNGGGTQTTSTGVSGGIIRYCIHYDARGFTPLARMFLASGLFQHRTFFVVQNEPY